MTNHEPEYSHLPRHTPGLRYEITCRSKSCDFKAQGSSLANLLDDFRTWHVACTEQPQPQQTTASARIAELEQTLEDVLSHIRPQGHPGWRLNTCLVTNEQLATWRRILTNTADHELGQEQS